MFRLSDQVIIVGGVLQEYSVRLDGLTGIVTSSRHDAPAGTVAVFVYWDNSPYHDRIEELPKWVNVPPQYLTLAEGSPPPPKEKPAKEEAPQDSAKPFGGLHLVN